MPRSGFIVIFAIEVCVFVSPVANSSPSAPLSGIPLFPDAASTGALPSTDIPAIRWPPRDPRPFEIDGLTFSPTLRIVDPEDDTAPCLQRILEELYIAAPINSPESEILGIGGNAPIAHETAPCGRLSGEIPNPA